MSQPEITQEQCDEIMRPLRAATSQIARAESYLVDLRREAEEKEHSHRPVKLLTVELCAYCGLMIDYWNRVPNCPAHTETT